MTRIIQLAYAIGSGPLARALGKTIKGIYKTGLFHCQGLKRNTQNLEMATVGWPYGGASIA